MMQAMKLLTIMMAAAALMFARDHRGIRSIRARRSPPWGETAPRRSSVAGTT